MHATSLSSSQRCSVAAACGLSLEGMSLGALLHDAPLLAASAHCGAALLASLAAALVLPSSAPCTVSTGHAARSQLLVVGSAGALALCLPGLGVLALAVVVLPAWRRLRRDAEPSLIELAVTRPPADPGVFDEQRPGELSPICQVLAGNSSTDERIAAVMALRRMPAREALPLLRRALRDPSEDVRLLAYAIVERREKTLRARISHMRSELEQLSRTEVARRFALLRGLAHEHWELAYAGFVSGELAQVALQDAARHAREAIELRADASLLVLLARLQLRDGQPRQARITLQRARDLGVASSTLAPLLAEIAFALRQYRSIPQLLRLAGEAQLRRPGLSAIARHWLPDDSARHSPEPSAQPATARHRQTLRGASFARAPKRQVRHAS